MIYQYCIPERRSGKLPLLFTSGTTAVKLDVIPEQSKILRQFSRQIDDDSLGNVHDLTTQNANEMVMAAGVRVVALPLGINGEFPQYACLRERIERIVDCRERHGLVFFRHSPVDVLRRRV